MIASVPLQGTYLPYVYSRDNYKIKWSIVSVPLQGTYLPYTGKGKGLRNQALFPSPCRGLIFLTTVFRPLDADDVFPSPCRGLIFLTKVQKFIESKPEFPSPCRGLIFLTMLSNRRLSRTNLFPSPCRGLIFLTESYRLRSVRLLQFPSPCRGLIFLTREEEAMRGYSNVSVPLQGTYLPYGQFLTIDGN